MRGGRFRERVELKEMIARCGCTVAEVAARAGVARHTLSQILNGHGGGSARTWDQLARTVEKALTGKAAK